MARLTIDDLDVDGKRVLMRVDFNVPLNEDQNITDDFRIQAALPSIEKLLEKGARLILMSHLGRPKGSKQPKLSLKPVAVYLQKYIKHVAFAPDCVGDVARDMADKLQKGAVLLLENLRFHAGEKANDPDFARQLAELGDIYVNDAFGTSHRAHASMAGVAEHFEQRAAGYLLEKELHYLGDYLKDPKQPYTAIFGGAKITGKIELIERFLDKVEYLLIGGGMSYTFLKAQGYDIGQSLLENDKVDLARQLITKAEQANCKVLLPTDVVVVDEIKDHATPEVVSVDEIPSDKMGVDIGPETVTRFGEVIEKSNTVLWNGPMGVFEITQFAVGTDSIAKQLSELTDQGAVTVVGGGDTAAAVRSFGLADQLTHVSTGGGASLELLSGSELKPISLISKK